MPRPLYVAFGEAVRRSREQRGLSQEDLGRKAGLHRNHVGEIERGETAASLKSIEVIAVALEMRPSELIALAEEKQA